jgi:hypothetical protein
MHRSGTSLTSNLLHTLDVNFGAAHVLAEPDIWNPRGYFENVEFQIMHDHLVMGDWVPARQWRTTPPSKRTLAQTLVFSLFRSQYTLPRSRKWISNNASKYEQEMRSLGEKYAGAAIKDPRFSFCLTEWAAVTTVEKVLYCYRHPYEVALSLRAGHKTPLWLGMYLWNRHVEEFLAQAAGFPLIMVNYDNYFTEQQASELQRLYGFVGKPFDQHEAAALISRVLDPTLKRNIYDGAPLPGYVARQYERLTMLHQKYGRLARFEPDKPTNGRNGHHHD